MSVHNVHVLCRVDKLMFSDHIVFDGQGLYLFALPTPEFAARLIEPGHKLEYPMSCPIGEGQNLNDLNGVPIRANFEAVVTFRPDFIPFDWSTQFLLRLEREANGSYVITQRGQ